MKTSHTFSRSLLIISALGFFALPPMARAVVPAPDGGYPGGNTAEGQKALFSLSTGQFNSALGFLSLSALTAGNFCTGVGAGALLLNTADGNTAVGAAALLSNTIGSGNTATGLSALGNNTDGIRNTANGVYALNHNISGGGNTAIGYQALVNNIASSNTAVGNDSLVFNTNGQENTANGAASLQNNTSGSGNTAIGISALASNIQGNGNTAVGGAAGFNATGGGNVYIGINMLGVAGESDHTYIRNINNTSVNGAGTDTVTVDLASGLLGHLSSSRRYKENIQPMDDASEVLFALKPVTYRYKKEIDQTQSLDYGLIAEDVAQVDPNLAIRDGKGQVESVRYNAVNAMLLNEFLKAHRRIEEQDKRIEQLTAGLKKQASQIQKVSAQLELQKRRTQIVTKNL